MKRREFIKNSLVTGGAIATVGANVFQVNVARANWKEKAYDADNANDAIAAIFDKGFETSKAQNVKMKAPGIAENGLVVPITIDARKRNDVKSIAIIVDENPRPMTAFAEFDDGSEAFFATRIKMAKTSNVRAVLNTNAGLEEIAKEVKVTIGGCGG